MIGGSRRGAGAAALAAGCLLATGAAQAVTPVIRVFTVFCNAYPGESGAINLSVSSDRFLVHSMFSEHIPEQGWGVKVLKEDVSGEEASRGEVQRRFADFTRDVRPEDTVYVHFSGHGVIPDPASGRQFLQTCDLNLLSRDEWAGQISRLPCRLKIFVTDCCSSYPPSRELAEGDEDVEPWETLYFLLLRHEGFVDITAASPGQAAYGTERGGYLTVNLESDMQRYRTWDEVFRATQARVFEETLAEARAMGDPRFQPQRPYAFSLSRPTFVSTGGAQQLPDAVAYVIPDSDRRAVTREELDRLGLQQLYFARNEVMARHGYDFQSPLLQRYFASRGWYQRREGVKSPKLSPVESGNVERILEMEKEKGGPFVATASGDDAPVARGVSADIFGYSSQRPLSRAVVQSLSLRELSLARNEIYARHGYPFKTKALQDHFKQKPWYRPNPRATEPSFTAVEEQNLWLLRKIERIKGGAYKW